MARRKPRVIGFVGAPSTGKTTLARAVANEAGLRGLSVEFVAEYARTYIQRVGGVSSVFDQLLIFDAQARREDDAIGTGADLVVAETPTFTGYAFGLAMMGGRRPAAREAEALEVLHRWIRRRVAVYDIVYYLPVELPLQRDGTRLETERVRRDLDAKLKATLDLWVPYRAVTGAFEDRIKAVLEAERFPGRGLKPERARGRHERTG
jgi:nicotinamide riboside kinase